jgi:signal transduction histidine kinase
MPENAIAEINSPDIPKFNKTRLSKNWAIGFMLAVLALALLGLAGWIWNIRLLTSVLSTYIPIAPTTVISFIVIAGILLIHFKQPLRATKAKIALFIVVLVALFGALEVVEYITGMSLNYEDVLIPNAGLMGNIPLARMSPATGGLFFLAGIVIAIILIASIRDTPEQYWKFWVAGIAGLIGIIALVFSLGYTIGAPLLYDGKTIPMAVPTAFAFVLWGIGVVLKLPNTVRFSSSTLASQMTIAVLALIFILTLTIGWATYNITSQKLEASALDKIAALASARQTALQIQIDDYLDDLTSYAQPDLAGNVNRLLEATPVDQVLFHENLVSIMQRQVPARRYLNSAAIADLSGVTIAATLPELEGLDLSANPVFAPGKIRATISDPFLDGGELLIDFSLPLIDGEGNTIAVLIHHFNANQILAITGDYTGLGQTGEALLGTRRGEEIYFLTPQRFNPDMSTVNPVPASGDVARPMIHATAGQSGLTTARDYRDTQVIAAYRPITSLGWGLVVKQDQNEAFSSIAQLGTNLMISMVIILIAGVTVTIPMVRSFVQPLKMLELATSQVASGDLTIQVPVSQLDEVGQLADTFNGMVSNLRDTREQLAKINQELTSFAYMVSHDLKAPLRGINTLSEWLEEDLGENLAHEQKEQMRLLRERVQRMDALINGLLDYSRIGRVRSPELTIDVNNELKNVIDSISTPEEIQIKVISKMPRLKTIGIHLTQVFQNLISNAVIHHPGPKGNIEISGSEVGNYWEFAIRDDGMGIEPQYQETIFEMFHTLQTNTDIESTGIGLALVRKIVDEHGGSVWVESDGIPGQGSTFHFTWPNQKRRIA